MARRKTPGGVTNEAGDGAREGALLTPARVLIVSGNRTERTRLAARLCDAKSNEGVATVVGSCEQAASAAAALELICADHFDLVLIRADLPDGSGLELARRVAGLGSGPAPVLVVDTVNAAQAIEAMRCGAVDVISPKSTAAELSASVRAATAKARASYDKDARIARLTKVCKQLNQVRHEITTQVSTMCGDLVNAYQELNGQVSSICVASEFSAIIRQELDVETLLRAMLEFVLAKTGPTNAAVYLPSNSQDYSLGAYINYDLPKDTSDVMLETLAGVIAPKMEKCPDLRAFTQPADLDAFLGEQSHWLAGQTLVTFSCFHDGECLAVIALFRDKKTPFTAGMLPLFKTVAELFGKQLARVIHVHHRHLPKDQWGGFGAGDDEDESDDRMAA